MSTGETYSFIPSVALAPNNSGRVLQSVSIDFIFGFPEDADKKNGILVLVDRFSKMVHLAEVQALITAQG